MKFKAQTTIIAIAMRRICKEEIRKKDIKNYC